MKAAKAPTSTAKATRTRAPKAAKPVAAPVPDFRIWCERCSIRIAPNEERIAVRKLIYHTSCYSKLTLAAKNDAADGRPSV
jgi:hypothetical protein